eukprot:UN05846
MAPPNRHLADMTRWHESYVVPAVISDILSWFSGMSVDVFQLQLKSYNSRVSMKRHMTMEAAVCSNIIPIQIPP